jgi:hypothetical protein
MIFTDLIVKEMCLRNSGNWPVELQRSAEHSWKPLKCGLIWSFRNCWIFSVRVDRIYGFEEVAGSFIVSFNTGPVWIRCRLQCWLIFFEPNIKHMPWTITLSWHLSHTSVIPKILLFIGLNILFSTPFRKLFHSMFFPYCETPGFSSIQSNKTKYILVYCNQTGR